ncbi:hypothetical protein ASPWEDRAFT_43117 [Aspergillus wentii DTO 134E9]|uniref:BRCT domain-containing protein n=1 Tax=Aspergillus wentii DTO 134E9 TaxID=1073089 RepID=A0A1L9RDX6_ASPWE|nr:uncharacterized protein ASPWEDRAFT_43117 [Aspergillus wentii DTO 134E9]OJJ33063.1 hypothetical protein ASPWEDRAFT_43117 [Aspergillus wentii DTO 134E9]
MTLGGVSDLHHTNTHSHRSCQETEPSQSIINYIESTESTSEATELSKANRNNQHSSDESVSATGQSLPKSSTPSHSQNPSHGQHATSSINEKHSPAGSDRPITTLLPQSGKMGSADSVPSDTQVISQTVFDNIIKQNKDAPDVGFGNVGDRGTIMTLHEGDSGHIDLLAGFDSAPADAMNTEDNENEDQSSPKLGESSPMHYQPNLFPESQRFLSKTPATAVKQGHPEGFSSVTPCASRNPLTASIESSGGIMALSQVFRATQAPSSPLVNHQQSDPMSDRPSPNLPIQSHPLATALSSPFNHIAATFPRDSSESQMNYITMKESQAQRDKILGERMTRSVDYINSEDHSDSEFNKDSSFVERLRRQKAIDEETSAQFAGLTAPARPSSRSSKQAEKQRTSPVDNLATRNFEDTSVAPALDDETTSAFQNAATSEEETEQEDIDQHIPQSQEPHSSVEDKENYNGPPAPAIVAATNAHDRLSQALALQESPSRHNRASSKQPGVFRRHSRSPTRDEIDGTARSSQILIVKDSQQSPRPNDEGNDEGNRANQHWEQDLPRNPSGTHVEPSSELEKVASSPMTKRPLRSSPPAAPQRIPLFSQLQDNQPIMRTRSLSVSSHGSSSQLPKVSSAPDGGRAQSSYPVTERPLGAGGRRLGFDSREKSSSVPSRIAETPVSQRPRGFGDVISATSIPETSPNRSQNPSWTGENCDTMNQDDDDLLPLYSADHGRASQSRPSGSGSSSPAKAPSKILSSPSGKQCRRLTEIAGDLSPQAGTGYFEGDIGILTADDREFSSVVSMSPNPPRKKRRGNDGKNIYASDPILPVTPRSTTSQFVNPQAIYPGREEPRRTESMVGGGTAFQRRFKPSRRVETVWEVDETPEIHVSRTARSRKLARARHHERQSNQVQKSGNDSTPQPAVVHNGQELAQDIASAGDKENANTEPHEDPIEDIPVKVKRSSASDNIKIALNQVLAPWSGKKRVYCPATCLGTPIGVSQSRYLVKFEDSDPVEVPIGGVKRLELRVGDSVKVDMPNFPKAPHVIRGFDDKLSEGDLCDSVTGLPKMTDIYGHLIVILEPKQRKSLPNGGIVTSGSVFKVPISSIYLDTILWNQLKDRTFTYDSETVQSESRLQTPSNRHSTPASPGTRLSRSIHYYSGIFAGMVFAVTYSGNDEAKSRITKLILDNDGRILTDGFNELFEFPSNVPFASPTKLPDSGATGTTGGLRLTRSAEEVGFACLIADQHSRREKYMQALALNLPCLSPRWVEDCVAQNRILDWEMYLLPAGESMYLHGATKSRMLTPNPPTTARLSETISGRPNLLNRQSVLLVMGRGKQDDKKKAYVFLTYALGASRVERVPDLESAKEILDRQKEAGVTNGWDWVYVHGYDEDAVRSLLLGAQMAGSKKAQSSRGSKKRKRDELMGSINGNDVGLDKSVQVVGNEFVVQSLILGRLFEA